jgi:hypothetical protein
MSISIQGSLRTCKIEQGEAPRYRSSRFEDPNLMSCPVWSGRDNVGRSVSEDSYRTKLEGCNTPLDRVDVENTLRPQYMENINVDSYGFRADIYERFRPKKEAYWVKPENLPDGCEYSHCSFYPYDWHDAPTAVIADYSRRAQYLQHQAKGTEMRRLSGFY